MDTAVEQSSVLDGADVSAASPVAEDLTQLPHEALLHGGVAALDVTVTGPPLGVGTPPRDMVLPEVRQRQESVQGQPYWLRRGWPAVVVKLVLIQILAVGLPFLIYDALAVDGVDITHAMYGIVAAALVITAYLIAVESLSALRLTEPPLEPASPYPPATAIVAAYLPNEAATIVETVEAMLRVEYPAPLQVILAYNTPYSLPVEAELGEMAQRDPRLLLLPVEGSTSKARNLNRAIVEARGAFVGIFDADHHPSADAFTRAWRWLSRGYDVVQGHCVVRNGDQSWVARLAAVDFEVMYAIGHPGRARMHGFGIFDGTNGYWRAELLQRTDMHETMLTEDIDATMRVVQQGYKIASDPLLISRELGPITLRALWNQRIRWAQGWFQVGLKHHRSMLRSPHLSLRQKLGAFYLLCWREIYVWLSVQMVPVLAFQLWHDKVNWFSPLLVLGTVVTVGMGPLQALLAYAVAAPEVRRRRWWFISYAVLSMLFFTGFKNYIARIAQIREALGEWEWKVTPRSRMQGLDQGLEV